MQLSIIRSRVLTWLSIHILVLNLANHCIGSDELVITVAGDFGFNASKAPPDACAGFCEETQQLICYDEMTAGIAKLFDGDLNIVNLESTVLDTLPNPGLPKKSYLFTTHPAGIEHMSNLGVNLWTLANNHVWDYGEIGLRRTLENLDRLKQSHDFQYVGAGRNLDEAVAIRTVQIQGRVIAVGSIGIIDNAHPFHRADDVTPGTLSFRNRNGYQDYELLLKVMAETKADYRILAIHYGKGYRISLDRHQRDRFHKALEVGKVDLIVGHHPHVVRPVEVVNREGRKCIIAYSLGNFLHPGTGKIEHKKPPLNFGMFLRIRLGISDGDSIEPDQVEMVPLLGMHSKPYVPEEETFKKLINSYNTSVAYGRESYVKFDVKDSRAVFSFGE